MIFFRAKIYHHVTYYTTIYKQYIFSNKKTNILKSNVICQLTAKHNILRVMTYERCCPYICLCF